MNRDLISRKALVKALIAEREKYPPEVAERYSFGVKLPHRFNQAVRGAIRMALRYIETAPAIDAEPVRHGRWEGKGWSYSCSICGGLSPEDGGVKTNYCPDCGAKMDLEVQDE